MWQLKGWHLALAWTGSGLPEQAAFTWHSAAAVLEGPDLGLEGMRPGKYLHPGESPLFWVHGFEWFSSLTVLWSEPPVTSPQDT